MQYSRRSGVGAGGLISGLDDRLCQPSYVLWESRADFQRMGRPSAATQFALTIYDEPKLGFAVASFRRRRSILAPKPERIDVVLILLEQSAHLPTNVGHRQRIAALPLARRSVHQPIAIRQQHLLRLSRRNRLPGLILVKLRKLTCVVLRSLPLIRMQLPIKLNTAAAGSALLLAHI
ncbi:hypothetical protein [Burkholderia sp. Z1]|uniref:hypothetical protein n=1 Tax=Burkholderia sp. Z1 TaxID=2759039 RepID=UPI001865B7D3|nr:hypothetical protein [Burkholderia sp. Z1]